MDFLMEHEHHHMPHDFEHLKIAMAQYYASLLTKLKDHIDDHNVHVTLEEKERWNKKADGLSLEELELKLLKKANISDIPTLISELKNDVPYLTAESLNAKLNALDFVTWADLKYKDYITADEVNRLIRNIVIDPSNINLYDYVKKNELATINGQVLYNGGNITVSGGSGSGSDYTLPVASDTTLGGIKTGFVKTGNKFPVQLNGQRAYVEIPADEIVIDPSVIDVDFSDVQRQIDELKDRLSNFLTQWNAITDADLAQIKADALAQINEALQAIEDAKRILDELFGSGSGSSSDAGVIIDKLNGLVSMFADYYTKSEVDASVTHIKDEIDAQLAEIRQSIEYINTITEEYNTYKRTVNGQLATLDERLTHTVPGTGTVTSIGQMWNAVEGKMTQYVTHEDFNRDVTNEVKTTLNGLDPSWSTVVTRAEKGEKAYGVLFLGDKTSTILNALDSAVKQNTQNIAALQTTVENDRSTASLIAGLGEYNPETGKWTVTEGAFIQAVFEYVNGQSSSSINLSADKINLAGTTFANRIIAEYISAHSGYFDQNIMIGNPNGYSIFLGKYSGTGVNANYPVIQIHSGVDSETPNDDIFDVSNDNDSQAISHFGYNGSGWVAHKQIQWDSEGRLNKVCVGAPDTDETGQLGTSRVYMYTGSGNASIDFVGNLGSTSKPLSHLSISNNGFHIGDDNGSPAVYHGRTGYVQVSNNLYLVFKKGIMIGTSTSQPSGFNAIPDYQSAFNG